MRFGSLRLLKGRYINGNGVYLCLEDEKEGPYADVTINIPPVTTGNIIAINGDFADCSNQELVEEVIERITEAKLCNVYSGFAYYETYVLKESILDEIEELDR